MKTFNAWAFVAIIAVFTIVVGFIACDEGNGKDPCNCNPKAHLGMGESCNCGLKDCDCREQTGIVGGVTIRKAAGISVTDMEDAVEGIDGVYGLMGAEKPEFPQKFAEIHVMKTGKAWAYGEDNILRINLLTVEWDDLGFATLAILQGYIKPGSDINNIITQFKSKLNTGVVVGFLSKEFLAHNGTSICFSENRCCSEKDLNATIA
jgi:hypothetical protein